MTVADVRVAVPATPGVEAGMVTLQETEVPNRQLDIIIGQPEARAIMAAWSGVVAARPSTWDLLVSTIGILDGRLERAVITAADSEGHFFAVIELERDGARSSLAARPSDALSLALRAPGSEIYVHEDVLATLGTDGEEPAHGSLDPLGNGPAGSGGPASTGLAGQE